MHSLLPPSPPISPPPFMQENPGIFTTVSRRGSLRNRVVHHQQRPPSYPAVVAGHSFDLNELGDDSDEDEGGFTSAPPPQYGDVIENPSGYVILSTCVCIVAVYRTFMQCWDATSSTAAVSR